MAKKPRHRKSQSEPGVDLTVEVQLTAEWPEFVTNMVKVGIHGFLTAFGLLESAGEAVSALTEAAGAIRIDSPPGERAWQLFALSFAWAFDELRATDQVDGEKIEIAIRSALEAAKSAVKEGGQIMPYSFLQRPTTLPLYQKTRDKFTEHRVAFRAGVEESSRALAARFDAAFNRAVFELWSHRVELFQPIATALNAPGFVASSFDLQWAAYRRRLIHDFEVRPVFGQEKTKISLGQLYIPLRAVWYEQEPPNERGSALVVPKARERKPRILRLDDHLDSWVRTAAPSDQIKLIGGGPGSGKSTTIRAFARRLADVVDLRPLLIPLAHINIDLDLRDAVNSLFVERTQGTFRDLPLSRHAVEDGPPLVLLFDGLDELAKPGEAANDLTRLFISKLVRLEQFRLA
ncbi:MAG: ATP-binding protein [Alphaproteobacteria bacterium]|nr:ATP-binding protein [Alphaproteobacteria bacterium]